MYASYIHSVKVFSFLPVLFSANFCLANKQHHFMLPATHTYFHLGMMSKKRSRNWMSLPAFKLPAITAWNCCSFSLDFFALTSLATLGTTASGVELDSLSAVLWCFPPPKKILSQGCPSSVLLASQMFLGHKER